MLKKVNSLKDLETELHSISDAFFPLQVQEYIQKDYEIIILGCSLNHGEEVVCPVAERKLRYYPQEFRTTAYTESLLIRDNQELLSITNQIEAMIKSIGYTGLFSVELIYANHSHYFLETNFRNDGTAYLATVCGYNLPDLLCQSFSGNKKKLSDNYKPCHYVNIIADGMNVIHGRVPLFTWVKQIRSARCYSHFSKSDRKPLFYAILALFINKYMIHYFVLPRHLGSLCEHMNLVENPTVEFFVSVAIAAFVIVICLLLSEIIRLSSSLSHVLLGTR